DRLLADRPLGGAAPTHVAPAGDADLRHGGGALPTDLGRRRGRLRDGRARTAPERAPALRVSGAGEPHLRRHRATRAPLVRTPPPAASRAAADRQGGAARAGAGGRP